jgi:hypothetical protein
MVRPTNPVPPHSWSIEEWPADVFPGNSNKGRRLCRTYTDELIAQGALTRIGRKLVVMGGAYTRWLLSRASHVKDFECPANRPEHAPKRAGRHRTSKELQ